MQLDINNYSVFTTGEATTEIIKQYIQPHMQAQGEENGKQSN